MFIISNIKETWNERNILKEIHKKQELKFNDFQHKPILMNVFFLKIENEKRLKGK